MKHVTGLAALYLLLMHWTVLVKLVLCSTCHCNLDGIYSKLIPLVVHAVSVFHCTIDTSLYACLGQSRVVLFVRYTVSSDCPLPGVLRSEAWLMHAVNACTVGCYIGAHEAKARDTVLIPQPWRSTSHSTYSSMHDNGWLSSPSPSPFPSPSPSLPSHTIFYIYIQCTYYVY